MSWLYSRALVAAYSADTPSVGAPSAPSRTTPTPQAYCAPDRMTAFSRLSRFGMTFGPFEGMSGEALLTWYRVGFHAQTFQRQEKARASTVPSLASGARWHELSVKYDRDSCSWKTHHCLFPVDLPESSVTLPRWGMMQGGVCWERDMLGLLTRGTASGLWQTPVADDAVNRIVGKFNSRGEPKLSAQVLWRTPCATDGTNGGPNARDSRGGLHLTAQVMWPTPQAHDCHKGDASRVGRFGTKHGGRNLNDEVAMFPTPTVNDSKNNGAPSQQERNTPNLNAVIGGSLNPTWVEWLMGWPLGWTDLSASATDRFQQWRQWHGGF